MRIFYTLTTLEPVIISRSSATTQHQTLDHIPGSALLGAMASKLYPQLSTEDAFTLFHSGECRFSPAYPVVTGSDNPQHGEIALPTPASWHTPKGDKKDLTNHAARCFARDELTQYQQIRQGFISSARALQYAADIRTGLTARTALESETQRAKEGQLFQYAFIQAEQTFAGWVDCAEPALAALLQKTLHGEFVLGRSRNSEFGKVSLSVYQPQAQTQTQTQPTVAHGNELVIWCLSDVACLDAFGQPTLTPSAQDLHPELCGELDPTRTFIRSHRVRRFNRARGGLNSEQLLIAAGSVLTYQLQNTPTVQTLQDLTEQGCGFAREQGLGWIMINPAWADQATPGTGASELFTPFAVTLPQQTALHETPTNHATSSPLLAWVQSKQAKQTRTIERKLRCQAMHHHIADAYQSLRRYHRTPPAYQAGPSSSQWRRLADLARSSHADLVHHDGILDWRRAAFDTESAICKTTNDPMGWGIEWPEGEHLVTFAQQLDVAIKRNQLDLDDLRLLLEELCRYDLSTDDGLRAYRKKYAANNALHNANNQQEAGQ